MFYLQAFYFLFFTAQPTPPSTTLNRNDGREHFYLVLDLGETFNPLPLKKMSAVGFSFIDGVYQFEEVPFNSYSDNFYHV